jgi:hypothetical protein
MEKNINKGLKDIDQIKKRYAKKTEQGKMIKKSIEVSARKGKNINGELYKSVGNEKINKTFSKKEYRIGEGGLSIDREDHWIDILKRTGGKKGIAVVTLSELLMKRKTTNDRLKAVGIAEDLLTGWSETELEHLTMLIEDGWDRSIGELLRYSVML